MWVKIIHLKKKTMFSVSQKRLTCHNRIAHIHTYTYTHMRIYCSLVYVFFLCNSSIDLNELIYLMTHVPVKCIEN